MDEYIKEHQEQEPEPVAHEEPSVPHVWCQELFDDAASVWMKQFQGGLHTRGFIYTALPHLFRLISERLK